jgi:hypothetical protein
MRPKGQRCRNVEPRRDLRQQTLDLLRLLNLDLQELEAGPELVSASKWRRLLRQREIDLMDLEKRSLAVTSGRTSALQ